MTQHEAQHETESTWRKDRIDASDKRVAAEPERITLKGSTAPHAILYIERLP